MGTQVSRRSIVHVRAALISTTPRRVLVYAAGLASAGTVLLATVLAFAALTGAVSYAPPASGAFAYNSFVPLNAGVAYVDPVFGETVRRLSADHGLDDIYARNMWWSADETRYLHRTSNVPGKGDNWDVIDVATGVVTHTGIPFGSFAYDGGFDPVDPNVLYYLIQDRGDGHGEIHAVTLNVGGTWSDAVYFTAPGQVNDLGGSMNWLDASGRYMLVRYGAEPSVHLYDRQNLAAGPYAKPIDASNYVEVGAYLGLSPDGQYIVGYDGRAVGFARAGQGVSWRLDHGNRAIAAAPNVFWSLCGDHGSFLSASDGRNYMITYDCYSQAGLWRVDITNNAAGLNETQQQTLPNNLLLLAYPTWSDFGHVSTVARGALRDWAFTSSEDGTDGFTSGTADSSGNITPWHPYRQEIIAVNVLTGEIRRLAHHRSRGMNSDYYSQPRLSASWGGAFVGFPSNFNQSGRVDIYAIPFAAPASSGPSDPSITVTRAGTGSGMVTGSPAGITCGGTCTANYASGTALTLTASPAVGSTFAGWSGACTGTGACGVTLNANVAVTAMFKAASPSVSIADPTSGATVFGNVQVSATASAPAGVASVQFLLDGHTLGLKDTSAPYAVNWDTTRVSNGVHVLTAVATGKGGRTATAAPVTITVMNPLISAVGTSSVSSSGATITWTTSSSADSQVDYGPTTAYGASTTRDAARITAHSQTLSGLLPGTLYHYRVKSRNAAGSLAVSGDFTFTTPGAGGGQGGGTVQNVIWTSPVNVTVAGNSLQKTSGCDGCDDAGALSQQEITSGNGSLQFVATEKNLLRFASLSHGATGTSASVINFAIRLQGTAEVRENGVYMAETAYTAGDVFRIGVETGIVKYSKNGTVFYTSRMAPAYPLKADVSLLNLSSTVTNAVMSF